jgi:glycerophosphoryl diester phosphodiesterase
MTLVSIPIIAHRTCPLHAPENSLAGVRIAIALGADGVEIDVRLTGDGVPVLMHDRSPMRTTGMPGPVSMYSLAELRRARLEDTGEPVPTLQEVLELLPDTLLLALEVKDTAATEPSLDLVRQAGAQERTLLWSYREAAVGQTARSLPDVEPTLLRDDTDPEGVRSFLDTAELWGARGISAHWDLIEPTFVDLATKRGLRVYSMTRDLNTVSEKAAAGLAAIVTDHPSEVRSILEKMPARREGLLLPA